MIAPRDRRTRRTMRAFAFLAVCAGTSFVFLPTTSAAPSADDDSADRRGCCSHHGGVCGCEKGRAKCCDGKMSPTCGCD